MKKRKDGENIIDLAYIKTFSGGDTEFVKEMVELYIDKIPQELEALDEATKATDWNAAYKANHDLKSSISFIGMKYLKEDVLDLEHCLKFEEDLHSVPDLKAHITGECLKAIEELKKALVKL